MPRFDLRFVYAGLAFTVLGGSALGAVNLALVHASLGAVAPTHVQAHAHAQTFGFIVMFICGFGQFLLPRMSRRELPHPRLARVTFGLLGGGAALHFFGQPIALWLPGRVLLGLSAPLILAGASFFALNVRGLLSGVQSPPRFERFVRFGAGALVAGAALDAVLALQVALGGEGDGLYGLGAQALWHIMVYGVGAVFTLGIAVRAMPAFLGSGPARDRVARVAFAVLAVGVPAQALALLVAGEGAAARTLDLAARATVGAGLLLGVASLRWRSPRVTLVAAGDATFHWTIRAAFGSLALAGSMRVATAAAEALGAELGNLTFDAERHLVTVGFLVTSIVAMAPRLLPLFLETTLRLSALRAVSAILLTTGVAMRTSEAIVPFGFPGLLRLSAWSGAVAWLGLVLFAVMIVVTVRGAGSSPRR